MFNVACSGERGSGAIAVGFHAGVPAVPVAQKYVFRGMDFKS